MHHCLSFVLFTASDCLFGIFKPFLGSYVFIFDRYIFQNSTVTFGRIEELFTGYPDKSNFIVPFDTNTFTLLRVGK
jgi:hypothetical protein